MAKRGKVPYACLVLDEVNAGSLQVEGFDLDCLVQQRKQLNGNIQNLRLYEWCISAEVRIVRDREVLNPEPGGNTLRCISPSVTDLPRCFCNCD